MPQSEQDHPSPEIIGTASIFTSNRTPFIGSCGHSIGKWPRNGWGKWRGSGSGRLLNRYPATTRGLPTPRVSQFARQGSDRARRSQASGAWRLRCAFPRRFGLFLPQFQRVEPAYATLAMFHFPYPGTKDSAARVADRRRQAGCRFPRTQCGCTA